jgi:hypothetical protein
LPGDPFSTPTTPSNAGESISVHSCRPVADRELYCNFYSMKVLTSQERPL